MYVHFLHPPYLAAITIFHQVNKALWSVWEANDNRTSNVLFATFGNNVPGPQNDAVVSFSTALTEEQAAEYTIATALGSDYDTWVDKAYIS